jgi:16S rRNA processing protein RimM
VATDQSDQHAGWIAVGQVMGAFGQRGELRVKVFSRAPQRFRHLRQVYVGEEHTPAAVMHRRLHGDGVILRLDSVDSRDEARAIVGKFLYVPESEAVALPEGEYFIHQIVGLTVRTVSGETLGTIQEVLETGSNDVYVVKGGDREVLLPATNEVVKRIDLASGIMEVEPLAGLLD